MVGRRKDLHHPPACAGAHMHPETGREEVPSQGWKRARSLLSGQSSSPQPIRAPARIARTGHKKSVTAQTFQTPVSTQSLGGN